jgi:mannose-1-phosphate guanylyltransferase/mannose-6-phosphate isomerase
MTEHKMNIYPVLLAGGSGTRLWPVSRQLYPKQVVKFIGDDSLIQSTIKRLTPVFDTENIRIVCGKAHAQLISRHMQEIGIRSDKKIICEPCGRNTAPAILLAMLNILREEEDAVVCIFPADHVIRNTNNFHEKVKSAVELAKKGYVVTFGIKPHYPETGYGYIEGTGQISDQAHFVKRFVEKPDLKTAEQYIEAGTFFWNSGMFTFKASVMLKELKIHHPELLEKMERLDITEDMISPEAYEILPNISIDYAVMEKTDKGALVPSDFGWSDIGSWKSLYDFLPKDQRNNVVNGDVMVNDTQNCLIIGNERLVATNSINNMVVVETPDSVFVSDLDNSRNVKSIVARLKEEGRLEYQEHKTAYHRWGTLTLLDVTDAFNVAKLVAYPGSSFHIKAENDLVKTIMVVSGQTKINLNGRSRILKQGETFTLSGGNTVRVENPGKDSLCLIQLEVKTSATA